MSQLTDEQRLERADNVIRKAAMALGSTDEWTDQETMIADFEDRFTALRAERVAKSESLEIAFSIRARIEAFLEPKV